jgi:branched-chain amino acid transport system substrate-binding protein
MKLRTTLMIAAAMSIAAFATARADILVATAGPMTGEDAVFGEQMKRGAEAAVADINAKGGVLGQKLKLVIEDDQCDAKQAVAVANKFASEGVKFVAGHYCSSTSIPASAVYHENNILQITPASTNPALTDDAAKKGWKNVFRTCGRDDAQGAIAGAYLAKKYAGKKVAILHDKTAYGKGVADETMKAMEKGGLKPAMYDSFTKGDKDFSALISKMRASAIDAVYIGSYSTETGLMVRQARDQGWKVQFFGEDADVTEEFWKITGPAGEGFLMTFAPDPRNVPAAKAIVEKFKKAGYDPEGYTLYTYAAFQVYAEAAAKAKSTDTAKLAAAIHGGSFNTVIGTLSYDTKGDIKNPEYVWYIWHDGKYAETK